MHAGRKEVLNYRALAMMNSSQRGIYDNVLPRKLLRQFVLVQAVQAREPLFLEKELGTPRELV